MRVVYDISVLGRAHSRPLHRGGIARVVHDLACALDGAGACDLVFSAARGFQQQCLDFLEATPDFARASLPHARRRRAVYSGLRTLNARATGAVPALHALQERGVWDRLVGALGPELDRTVLAGAEIFHSSYLPVPGTVRRACSPQQFLTVYDLIPVRYPQFCGPRLRALFQRILHSIDERTWVFVSSEAVKADLCACRGTDPSRVFVTPWAADPTRFYPCRDPERLRKVREKYGLPDAPYLLSLGTLEPRKNLDHVIRCFAAVARQQRGADLRLVLVGARGWYDQAIFQELSSQSGLRDRIFLTGHVPDEDLSPLYAGATAFVFMSRYEGFGLPALEAMQCGAPVIAANTSSLPEVIGDAGLLLAPDDADGLCQAILDVCSSPTLRAELAARSVRRAAEFSWERCAAETIAAYGMAIST